MTIEVLFYTQIASIVGFVGAAFVLYRLLVRQKDSVIELLRERNRLLEARIGDVESQSPDVLVDSLAKRIDIAKKEIENLSKDGEQHLAEISRKEKDLANLNDKLGTLIKLLEDSDLLCPECQAPLSRRNWHTIHGEIDGREVEADIEYVEYECGYATREDRATPLSLCGTIRGKP